MSEFEPSVFEVISETSPAVIHRQAEAYFVCNPGPHVGDLDQLSIFVSGHIWSLCAELIVGATMRVPFDDRLSLSVSPSGSSPEPSDNPYQKEAT